MPQQTFDQILEHLSAQLKREHEREVTDLRVQLSRLKISLQNNQLADSTKWAGTPEDPHQSNHHPVVTVGTIGAWDSDRPHHQASKGTPVVFDYSAKDGDDEKSQKSLARSGTDVTSEGQSRAGQEEDAVNSTTRSVRSALFPPLEVKGAWLQNPVATDALREDLDKQMVTEYAHNMLETVQAHIDDEFGKRPTPQPRRRSVVGLQHIPRTWVVNPGAPGRVAWDLSGMLLISYDMIVIPMHLSFEPAANALFTTMGWITLLFWSIDMLTSVFTGYYENGKLIMQQKKIIINYLRGWFWVDCIVVIPDWVMKMMGSVTNVAGLGRILRIARIMRVLRLLRLLKLKKIFNIVYDMIDSEVMFIVVNLVKLLTVILIMNHMVACAWYMVGRLCKNAGAPKNWLQDRGLVPVWGQDFLWKYVTSLHWSITQFTPASMDVSATNVAERCFSIVILFWALVALSSIIGSVSASMTALRNMSSDENKQFWILRRYLKQKNISLQLRQRIIKYLEFQHEKAHTRVSPGNVKLLGSLSEQFKIQLAHEMNSPFMLDHPFFRFLAGVGGCTAGEGRMAMTMHRLCHSALLTTSYAIEEVVFNPGDEGERMYFVKVGIFEYQFVDETPLEIPLAPKLWAAEASLWAAWRHRGKLTARRNVNEAMALVPPAAIAVIRQHPRPWYLSRNYAMQFVRYMNSVGSMKLTDVIFEHDVWEELVKGSDTYTLCRSGRGLANSPKRSSDEENQARSSDDFTTESI